MQYKGHRISLEYPRHTIVRPMYSGIVYRKKCTICSMSIVLTHPFFPEYHCWEGGIDYVTFLSDLTLLATNSSSTSNVLCLNEWIEVQLTYLKVKGRQSRFAFRARLSNIGHVQQPVLEALLWDAANIDQTT